VAGPRRLIHLASRLAGSLRPGTPDDGWAEARLTAAERDLWRRMPAADRSHAIAVARRVGSDERAVIAAALLHDVGKVESGLGTAWRVAATIAGAVGGRDRWRGRVGAYLRHDAIGASLLEAAGSDPLTVAWSREHHLPPEAWTVPLEVGHALKAADDD
jgi:acyl-CoA reductase-like NAD-dependent aldehyde dehydrogenase